MKRVHLIEISDQPWCPQAIKDAVTDYCRFVLAVTKPYKAIAPLLAEALRRMGSRRVLDLGSGAAGPWLWLQPLLAELGVNVAVCLSDKYPNLDAFERARRMSQQTVMYYPSPVDATRVPNELSGFRTIFTAFHHFPPEQARALLADAMRQGEGIGAFDFAKPSLLLLPLLVVIPLRVLLVTPFIRPFRWSRLFWTYLLPVVPLVLLFDSVVSCLRMYTVQELRALTVGLDHYHWDAGTVWSKRSPIPMTYLVGVGGRAGGD
jgi:hypothetical protein